MPLGAQDPEAQFKLTVDVDMVEINVSVTDDLDRPVGGLRQEDFAIREDGVEQTVALFRREDIPVSLGLVIDNSRSMEPRKDRLDAAALSFVQGNNPRDETFIVHFDSEARLTLPFANDPAKLEAALAGTKPFGETAVYDALAIALAEIEKARHSKKALLLVTDGVDNASEKTLDETVDAVKRSHVAIYTVGLLSRSGGTKAEDALIRIVESSGGRAYFPDNVEEAQASMERAARHLRERYSIGYIPTNGKRDGAWRSVRVDVAQPKTVPHLNVDYRHGYFGREP
jgi:Ca-activated chloride channel family protein